MDDQKVEVTKQSNPMASAVIIASILISLSVFYLGYTLQKNPITSSESQNSGTVATPAPTQTPVPAIVDVEIGDAPVLGKKDAPVTIIEFSDFSCPFCGAVSGDAADVVASMKKQNTNWEPAIPAIIKNYIDTGKVKLAFKYFPGHGSGEPAMLVAWCLNDQNLFWKFHNLAFANQTLTDNLDEMKKLAIRVGAKSPSLDSCLTSKKYDSKLTSDTNYGQSVGVSGTPAFFIGKSTDGDVIKGERIVGAQPYSAFDSVIKKYLSEN